MLHPHPHQTIFSGKLTAALYPRYCSQLNWGRVCWRNQGRSAFKLEDEGLITDPNIQQEATVVREAHHDTTLHSGINKHQIGVVELHIMTLWCPGSTNIKLV